MKIRREIVESDLSRDYNPTILLVIVFSHFIEDENLRIRSHFWKNQLQRKMKLNPQWSSRLTWRIRGIKHGRTEEECGVTYRMNVEGNWRNSPNQHGFFSIDYHYQPFLATFIWPVSLAKWHPANGFVFLQQFHFTPCFHIFLPTSPQIFP